MAGNSLSRYMALFALWVAFTPFVTYIPITSSEYQPFFFIAAAAYFFTIYNDSEKKSQRVGGGLLLEVFIPSLCVLAAITAYMMNDHEGLTFSFRFLSFYVGLLFFRVFRVVELLAKPRPLLFLILGIYCVIAVLQIINLLPANLPITNRTEASVIDLLESGRGVPSLATEPSTFADVLVALIIGHLVSARALGVSFNMVFVAATIAALILLSKSTVYFLIFVSAYVLVLPFHMWRRPVHALFIVLSVPVVLLGLLPIIQPRSAELFLALINATGGFDGVLDAFATAGPQSFSFRATNLFGVPWFLYEDWFSPNKLSCNTFLFLETRCIIDASSLSGSYLVGGFGGKLFSVVVLCCALYVWFQAAAKLSTAWGFVASAALLSLLHVSANSPFFPLYFAGLTFLSMDSKCGGRHCQQGHL